MSKFTSYVKNFFNGAYLYMLGALVSLGITIIMAVDISKDALGKDNLSWLNFLPLIIFATLTIILFILAKISDADVEVDIGDKKIKINESKKHQ